MRTLKNTYKWLSQVSTERKKLLGNLSRINNRLNDLQKKEDGLIKDLHFHTKEPSTTVPQPRASGIKSN
jgi:hypothetical protein